MTISISRSTFVGSALTSLALLLGPAAVDRVAGSELERAAFAQQPDPVTEVARARYQEGVKAYEAGKFEDARTAFLQAYALKRVPAVLLNLGQSELRTVPPHLEDAGNHLQQFLREHTGATPEEKAAAERGIADAKRRTGYVDIKVDIVGADVAIDGTVIGKSPLPDPVFVKPGKHLVAASFQGKTVNDAVDAKIGAPSSISLALQTSAPPPVVAPVPLAPAPAPPPAAPPPSPPPSAAPANQGPPGGSDTTTGGQSFGQWYAKHPLAWVTTGVAGVGLIGGVAFSIAASSSASTTNDAAAKIRANLSSSTQKPCAEDPATSSDAQGFQEACQILRDDISAYHTDVALSVTGWVLLGVGGIATVTYAMVDWYPNRNKKTGSSTVHVVPVAAPGFRGLAAAGTF